MNFQTIKLTKVWISMVDSEFNLGTLAERVTLCIAVYSSIPVYYKTYILTDLFTPFRQFIVGKQPTGMILGGGRPRRSTVSKNTRSSHRHLAAKTKPQSKSLRLD